jgi:PPK2 family polyphosphate:nucleotide phosphotransferase
MRTMPRKQTAAADLYRVRPGKRISLSALPTADTDLFTEPDHERLAKLADRLNDLEDLLCAVHKQSVLVVLQGMDGAGKDEIVCNVFGRVNPARMRIEPFDEPTKNEEDHDFLWRAHRRVPGRGEIRVFDRSHYEGVLVDRVHGKVPPAVWKKRYGQIAAFEETLVNHDTMILKFFLHMSKAEQKRRLQERLEDPKKNWKFKPSDLSERRVWAEYQRAYQDAINKTSTSSAPWFVIPCDHGWYRDLIVAGIIVEALDALGLQYPKPEPGIRNVVVK